MGPISKRHALYTYISTKAAYDPVPTIYVCAPQRDAVSPAAAERFAVASGWQAVAEAAGAVLVLPLAPQGWAAEKTSLLPELYAETKNQFPTRSGKSLAGRAGFLWCWETLLYLVGYEEGAVFAGDTLAAYPNHFAAAALVNDAPGDYSRADALSDHWLVPGVRPARPVRNRELPVCLWLLNGGAQAIRQAADYFRQSCGTAQTPREAAFDGIPAAVYEHPENAARQVRVSVGAFAPAPALAQTLWRRLFATVIRWKDGPDGRLAPLLRPEALEQAGGFARHTALYRGRAYGYYVHVPKGLDAAQAAGLPLVFSVHGRGEPAWMFAQKNGWAELADETREFILAVPDSPENIWYLERDGGVFGQILEQLAARCQIDRTRVYLTGFSNGGMIAREVGTRWPQLFAALSPWNAPAAPTAQLLAGLPPDGLAEGAVDAGLAAGGYEMPCFVYAGDNDPAAPAAGQTPLLRQLLAANGCAARPTGQDTPAFAPDAVYTVENHYTPQRGYAEGERLTAYVYHDTGGRPRVSLTVLRDMPHGAVHDESRAAWELLRRWRRPDGGKQVDFIPEAPAQPGPEPSNTTGPSAVPQIKGGAS